MRTLHVVFILPAIVSLFGGCAAVAMKEVMADSFDSPSRLAAAALPPSDIAGSIGGSVTPPGASTLTLDSSATQPASARLTIYSAAYSLVVPDIRGTTASLQATAIAMGGYMQEMSVDSITIRIPAGRFADALAEVEKLGSVTSRNVKAADVTDEMRDLNIRLGNAAAVRERLLALIEKSTKMEDTISLEKELERVTETIELLKGKLQSISHQIAFSTLRVQLNSPLPQRQAIEQIPFAWVRELGSGVTAGNVQQQPDTSRWSARNTRFTLPEGYVRYYERDNLTEAMSASGVIIRLQRQDNYDGGKLSFWAPLCRRSIVEAHVIAPVREEDVTLDTGAVAHVILGARDAANMPRGYMLGIAVSDRRIYTFEAWGPKEAFDNDLPALKAALKTLRVGKW